MQVERPSRLDRINPNHIVTTHPKSNSQQKHSPTNGRRDKTQYIDGSPCQYDSNSDNNNDSTPTSPKYLDTNRSTHHRAQQTSPRKQQSTKHSQYDRTMQSEHTMAHSYRASIRSGAKRSMRPRQGEQALHLEQAHQRQPTNEFATQSTTSPRVTTAVAMTGTPISPLSRTAAGAKSNVTGSTSEQDEIEVRGLPSPGWKRARVRTGSRENLVATAPSSETVHNGSRRSSSGGRRGNNVRIPQPRVTSTEISNSEASGTERDDASEEERENRREIREVLANSLGSIHPAVTLVNSRRSPHLLHQYHNCNHRHHRHSCNNNANFTNARNNHQTHTRNFSSPSLLDSFTSPAPMLSPIQSYFGSDPNSPASSFSLPRHDHYPRLTVDPLASMDGYHGFATQPWSEQSTTPSRALSHRWTRRSSQSDVYDDNNNGSSTVNAGGNSASRQHRLSAALSWDTSSSSSIISNMSISRAPDETYEGEQNLASDDLMHDSNDEATVGESFDGDETMHGHRNLNLRNSGNEEIQDEGESYQLRYQLLSLDVENNAEDNEGDEEGGNDGSYGSDEDEAEVRMEDDRERINDDDDDDDDNDDEMIEATYVRSSYRSQDGSTLRSSSRQQSLRRPSASANDGAQVVESDEALARRLQEEEYTAMLGERSAYATFSRVISRYQSRRSSLSTPFRNRYPFGDEASPSIESQHYLPRELTSGSGVRDRDIPRSSSDISHRLLGLRPTFISSRSSNSLRFNREAARERSRSPPAPTTLPHSGRVTAAEREYRLARALELRLNSHWLSMNNMWGNPADYLNDDQVDDSYEGLLRLSEQIGDVKPKGIPANILRMMDKHVISWRRLRSKAKTSRSYSRQNSSSPSASAGPLTDLSSSSSSKSPSLPEYEDLSPCSLYSNSPYPSRPVTRSRGLTVVQDDTSVDEEK
ncbi:hypothetical protein BGX20_001008 [Mortierella sp. AD010]|nr:hypothetical protein BGX20_001008 [Mortierella sp. AD010]